MTDDPDAVVLTVIHDAGLSASTDRVAAAAGMRVVHRQSPGRKSWVSASAVVLDMQGAQGCAREAMPRRSHVFLVGSDEPSSATWSAALDVGAQHVYRMPEDEAQLVRALSDATETGPSSPRRGRAIAVTPGRGGAGASVFATAMAHTAGDALLMDLDPCGGGLDLLLGAESTAGLRWPDLRVNDGRLGWTAVSNALPRRAKVWILSSARVYHDIEPIPVGAVADAALRAGITVLSDVPRNLTPAGALALESADLVVALTTCDVRGVAATSAYLGMARTLNPNIGVVVRGPAPGGLRARDVADAVGAPLLAAMRPETGLDRKLENGGLRLRRRSPLALAARAVLA